MNINSSDSGDITPKRRKHKTNVMCCVPECSNRPAPSISLHIFPKKLKIKREWLRVLRIGKKISSNYRVCSTHFVLSDFYDLNLNSRNTKRERKILKPNVIPSQNLPQSSQISTRKNKCMSSLREKRLECRRVLKASLETNKTHEINPETYVNLDPIINEDITFDESRSFADKACQVDTISCPLRRNVFTEFITSNEELSTSTGIPTLNLFETIVEILTDYEKNEDHTRQHLQPVDRVMLVFLKMKQNLSYAFLAILFNVSSKTISRAFSKTLAAIRICLECAVYWPDHDEIKMNLPECFNGEFSSVRAVFDCTEIPISQLKCLNCRISSYSHYKHRNTCKFLIGVTPAGMISYISPAYSGKASDKHIFNEENLVGRLTSCVDAVMIDKGFAIENELAANKIKMFRPPFLRGNEQLSVKDAILNAKIAAARVHVERSIQRIKVFEIFQHTIDTQMLPHVDDMINVVCSIVNLSAPIMASDKF